MVKGARDANQVPEFHTGRTRSNHNLNLQRDDFEDTLDTTAPVIKNPSTTYAIDPIEQLADVLVNILNRPQAKRLSFCLGTSTLKHKRSVNMARL